MIKRISIVLIIMSALLTACAGAANNGSASNNNATGGTTGSGVAQAAQATITPFPTAPAAARPTYTVQRGTVQEVFEFDARWLPRDQIQLSFPIAGTIRSVNVQRGDTVSAGQLLADFQITELENQLADAELSLQTALLALQSGAEGSANSVVSAQFTLANARLSLENTQNSPPWIALDSARIGLEQARISYEAALRAYDDAVSRAQGPVDSARDALENARLGLRSAENSYYSAAEGYADYLIQLAQAENQVLQSEIGLQQAQSGQTGVDPERLQAVYSAQLQIDQINQQISQSSLYAPIDGVVLEITIRPGDQAEAFDAVITLALPEPQEAIAELAFNDTRRLSVGMVGVCQELNQPDTAVQCLVRQIPLTSRDADQTARVAATLPDTETGSIIEVTMPLQTRENALWLPPNAIRTFQQRTFVVLQTPDGEQRADVTLGLQTDERVEILSGVNEGDIVIAP